MENKGMNSFSMYEHQIWSKFLAGEMVTELFFWSNLLEFCEKSPKEIAVLEIYNETYSGEMPFIEQLKILLCRVRFV